MGKWFPQIYDLAMKPLERRNFKEIRKSLVNEAIGRVLEIGSGTGINFPLYKGTIQVDAVEPNLLMKQRSVKRIEKAKVRIQTYAAKAEKLPFADNTFDSVVATLVFCTIPDPVKALQEIMRVSKPGAKILLFEHVRVNQPALRKAQDVLTPAWKKICNGCHLNRDTVALLERTNLSIQKVDTYYKGVFLVIRAETEKST